MDDNKNLFLEIEKNTLERIKGDNECSKKLFQEEAIRAESLAILSEKTYKEISERVEDCSRLDSKISLIESRDKSIYSKFMDIINLQNDKIKSLEARISLLESLIKK